MIVIPLAGLSSRFFKAGYHVPKYQLKLGCETVFSWSVKSFKRYFETDEFVFIYREVYNTKEFIENEIRQLGIKDFKLVCLPVETKGQAETVFLGLNAINAKGDLFVFNIDSKLIDFEKPEWLKNCQGYLEVFRGEGEHWSFVEAGDEYNVIRTTEKERISDLCSDGLYYFSNVKDFKCVFEKMKESKQMFNSEYYIAPMYNQLITEGFSIKYQLVPREKVIFCGTPEEYLALLNNKDRNL